MPIVNSRRKLVFCWATAAICHLVVTADLRGRSQLLPREIVKSWVDSRTIDTAFEIVWERRAVRLDPSGSETAPGAKGQTVDVFRYSYRCRWPDALYTETELISRESGGRTIEYRTEQDPAVRAVADRRHEQLYIQPNGNFVRRYPGSNSFDADGQGASLRQSVNGFVMNIPALIGHHLADVGLAEADIDLDPSGGIRVRNIAGVFEYVFARLGPGTEFVLWRIESFNADGDLQTVYEYRDFQYADGCSYPVATQRAMFRPSNRTVIMDGDRPVRVEYSGELKENGVDRLVSYTTYKTLPDSAFIPDLEGFTTFDESSGELRDAQGTVVGHATAKRKISRPKQWSTLIGAGGAALIVFAAGAWWIRRRAA